MIDPRPREGGEMALEEEEERHSWVPLEFNEETSRGPDRAASSDTQDRGPPPPPAHHLPPSRAFFF